MATPGTLASAPPCADRSDGRRTARQALTAPATLFDGASARGQRIWVFNISLGGVAFRTHHFLAPNARHQILMEAGPLRLDSLVRIVWSRRNDDGGYETGAEFVTG